MTHPNVSLLCAVLLLCVAACQSPGQEQTPAQEQTPTDGTTEAPEPPPSATDAETTGEEEHAELAAYMSTLQRWSHKLVLSAHAQNQELTEFYLHELEEQAETIQTEAPTYEGHQIADLMGAMLMPQIDEVHAALEQNNWSKVSTGVDRLIEACNQCHAATQHGFIEISTDTTINPYNQVFEPMASQ